MRNQMFVEVDYRQEQKAGNEICGDVFLSHKIKEENRTIVILSDGLGSGTKANILASMTASMALNFSKANSPIEHTAEIIMNTLPVDSFRKISFSSFTILDIQGNRHAKLIEFGNPAALLWHNNTFCSPHKTEIKLAETPVKQKLYTSEFDIDMNDRIILFSDGVTQSGMGKIDMPFGWGQENLSAFLKEALHDNLDCSAGELARTVINQSLENDNTIARDDISCGVVYFRQPRKILFCTGPPYKTENDKYLAEQIRNFEGDVIISGGTTAQIVSREMQLEIDVLLDEPWAGLPPESSMEGMGLVTEGILTLGKVSEYLETLDQLRGNMIGPAGKIIRFFHNNDEIQFLVGTRVNEAHQDPNLPVELEIRRNVIKKVARLLESKFLKKVEIMYI